MDRAAVFTFSFYTFALRGI